MKPQDTPAATLSLLTYRLVNLSAELRRGNPLYDSFFIVQSALAIDLELDEWDRQLPASWRFTTQPAPGTAAAEGDTEFLYGGKVVFGGQVHVYADLWSSRIYNNYRWTRLLINELLVVHTPQLGSLVHEATAQKLRSLDRIRALAHELCTSVSTQFDRYTPAQALRKHVPPMSGCFLLLFPLAIAGSAIGVPDEVHRWVVQMLHLFATEMGISQAGAMLPRIQKQRLRWMRGQDMGFRYHVLYESLAEESESDTSSTSPSGSLT
jgi:hypothetical protein